MGLPSWLLALRFARSLCPYACDRRKQLSDRHPPAKCGPRGFSPTHQSYGQASDALLDPGNARGLAEQVGRHGAVAGEAFVMRLAFEPAVVDLLADDSPL